MMAAQNGCSPWSWRVNDQLTEIIVRSDAMRRASCRIVSAGISVMSAAQSAVLATSSLCPIKYGRNLSKPSV